MRALFWDDLQTVNLVEKELKNGGVVLAAGDTVLGLLADLSQEGYAQLDSLKNRSKKPYLILVADKQKALDLIEIDEFKISQIEKIINICWPGPVTLIFKAKSTVVQGVKSPEGNVAIRVPDHAGLLALLQKFDGLFSTSANTSGEPMPETVEDVESGIKNSVACIVLNKEKHGSTLPSTIIDCTGQKLKIVRQGAFSVGKLADFLME
jgi:L-threonylcarbamoyladenylate synthase